MPINVPPRTHANAITGINRGLTAHPPVLREQPPAQGSLKGVEYPDDWTEPTFSLFDELILVVIVSPRPTKALA
jgi:hypothetical protein